MLTPRPTALERIREFSIVADLILRNPVVVGGIRSEIKYEADPDGPDGRGTWSFVGPDDYLFRALLLDLRPHDRQVIAKAAPQVPQKRLPATMTWERAGTNSRNGSSFGRDGLQSKFAPRASRRRPAFGSWNPDHRLPAGWPT